MGIKELIAFSTRIPIKSSNIIKAAESSYLFPFIAILIVSIYGSVSLIFYNLVPSEIVSLLAVLFLYLTTGLIHLDGLSDLSDALLANVEEEEFINILKDEKTGVGGLFSIFFVLFTLYVSFRLLLLNPNELIIENLSLKIPISLILAMFLGEISAKLSLTTLIKFGEKNHKGLGSLFIEKTNRIKFISSLTFSLIISLVFGRFLGFTIFIGFFVGIFFSKYGKKTIGGINGDFMGAANEVSRALTILVITTLV